MSIGLMNFKFYAQAAENGVVRVWCALHQLDLVVQAEYLRLHDDRFVDLP
jgi:hypothetical protein